MDGDTKSSQNIKEQVFNAMKYYYGIEADELRTLGGAPNSTQDLGHLLKLLNKDLRSLKSGTKRLLNDVQVAKVCSYLRATFISIREQIAKNLDGTKASRAAEGPKPASAISAEDGYIFHASDPEFLAWVVDVLWARTAVVLDHLCGDHSLCLPDRCTVARLAMESAKMNWDAMTKLPKEQFEAFIERGRELSLDEFQLSVKGDVTEQRANHLHADSPKHAAGTSGSVSRSEFDKIKLSPVDKKRVMDKIERRFPRDNLLRVAFSSDTQRCESYFSTIIVYSHGKRLNLDQKDRWWSFANLCGIKMNRGRADAFGFIAARLKLPSPSPWVVGFRAKLDKRHWDSMDRKATDISKQKRHNKKEMLAKQRDLEVHESAENCKYLYAISCT